MMPLTRGAQSSQNHSDRKEKCGCLVWGRRGRKLLFKGYRVSVWGEEKVLEIDGGDDCTTMRRYLMPVNYTLKNG